MFLPPIEERLSAIAAAVEQALDAALSPEAAPDEIARPPRLVEAMRHAMLGGGKRLRPALVTAAADLFGADPAQALRAAVAVECVHGYSLVHDDLPAMDDDDLRRGRPTVHRAFDEATAILAGDALLTLAFDVLAAPATHPDPAVRIELVALVAKAAGVGGMVGGQMLDLAAEGRFAEDGRIPLDEAAVLRMQAMKTGALLAASVAIGAALGGAGPEQRTALGAYGRALGAAFQIADDLLDAEGSAEAVGKATGKDAAAGKGTLVGLLGPAKARVRLAGLVAEAETALSPFGDRARALRDLARFVGERDA